MEPIAWESKHGFGPQRSLRTWWHSDSWQKLLFTAEESLTPKCWRTVNNTKPNHDNEACNRLNEMGSFCDKKCIRRSKEEKIPRFPFCFIPFHLFHVRWAREWIITKTLKQHKKKTIFEQDSCKTLAIWTHQCLERIAHSIEWEEKDLKKKKNFPKHKSWTKDEGYNNSVKSYETSLLHL